MPEVYPNWEAIDRWIADQIELNGPDYYFTPQDLKKMTEEYGAYCIYIPANKFLYIGATNHLYRRRIKHIADLKNGVGENSNLQKAFDASSDDRIMFFFIRTAADWESALDMEQHLVDQYWGNPKLCNFGKNVRKPTLGVKYDVNRLAAMSNQATQRFIDEPERRVVAAEIAKEQWSNPESREVMIQKALPNLKLGIEATSLAVEAGGLCYPSMASAGRAYGIKHGSVANRIKSKNYPDWIFVYPGLGASEINNMYPVSEMKKEMTTDILEAVESDSVSQGMIIYGDGGSRPNPGRSGWGIHGYMYKCAAPKKSSGNPDYVLTATGYASKIKAGLKMGPTATEERRAFDRSIEVTPLHYIDGYGSFHEDVSNNVAELVATISALRYAMDYDINDIQIYTDSEYVRKGLHGDKGIGWVVGWERNNWLKADMTEPANVGYWKELVTTKKQLTDRGVKVCINWVRSHTDKNQNAEEILGNILADKLATIGVMASKMNKVVTQITSSPVEGYWKYDSEKHPMIANRRMYFNTMKEYLRPGEYYLGEHGKEDDLLGKRIADGAFSVVILATPDPILEMVRNHQSVLAKSTDTLMMARLDHLYRPSTHEQLMKYGAAAMVQSSPYRLDLACLDEEPLTRELRPPKLAMRAVENVSLLAEKLYQFLDGNKLLIETDITPILYETTVKTDKKGEVSTSMKLKTEYNVGFAAMDVEANYTNPTGEIVTAPITLTLGIDLLDRNHLKRLEELNPKVSLITWLEAPNVFRYATVIVAGQDRGIWAGFYSNLRIVTPPKS
jgi:ribonuclease HI